MGYNKLLNFFEKNLSSNCIKQYYFPDNNEGFLVAKHIFFDIQFIIYICINIIQKDINDIFKILCGVNYNNILIVKKRLNIIIKKTYWNNNKIKSFFKNIDNRKDKILEDYSKMLTTNFVINILYECILDYLNKAIKKIHVVKFIKSINIFFDGIPSYSKILEQRKRRLRSYLESIERKRLYKLYFQKLENNIVNEDGYYYEFFLWIKHHYSFSKSLGPQSNLIINLSRYLNKKLNNIYPHIKIYISNSQTPGESDYKIYYFLKKNKKYSDIYIHSCDSDLIHLTLTYQLQNRDRFVFLIKYNLNYSDLYDVIDSNKVINNIIFKYKYINNYNYNLNINIVYDILFIILMFGNAIIPNNLEISAELSFKIIFKCHYELTLQNTFIVNINNKCIINFSNLVTFLKNLQKYNTFTIILLNKYFKIPYNFVLLCTNTLNYSVNNIIQKLIIPYLSYQGYKNKDKLEINDVRIILFKKYKIIENPLDDLEKNIKNEIKTYFKSIFDFLNIDNYGLSKLEKYSYIENNSYQSLYNYISFKSINIVNNKLDEFTNIKFSNLKNIHKYISNINNFNNTEIVKKYLSILINQSFILFENIDNYLAESFLYYQYNYSPLIKYIIKFIHLNDMNELQLNLYNKLKKKENIYFDELSHQLIITPYLISSKYIDQINYNNNLIHLLNLISNEIKNIWYEKNFENFNLSNIDPTNYLKVYYKYKIFFDSNFSNILYYNYNKLIN